MGVKTRVFSAWVVVSLSLAAQPRIADYPAHARLPGIEIGAKHLPHGLPAGAVVSAGKDLIVVEVGVFPQGSNGINLSKSQFKLSVDGKTLLAAQSPGAGAAGGSVAVASDSSSRTGSVELGGPPLNSRPGGKQELESQPRRPIALDSDSGTSAPARKAALPEGPTNKPVSGYLFFRFEGDAKSIRSLDLIYDGGAGAKTRLRIL